MSAPINMDRNEKMPAHTSIYSVRVSEYGVHSGMTGIYLNFASAFSFSKNLIILAYFGRPSYSTRKFIILLKEKLKEIYLRFSITTNSIC